MVKNCVIFSDCDLDGIGSFLVFKWFTGYQNLKHVICSQSNFRKTFLEWLTKNKIEDYDKVYIFDLDVSQHNLDLVDHENVTVIDHHDTHVNNQDKYKNANTILTESTSCCKLIYSLLKKKYPEKKLSDHQKMLILMIDDYDNYELKVNGSYELNIILWSYVGKRAEQFCEDFKDGFKGFNKQHLNMIALNKRKVSRVISELQVYKGELPIKGKKYIICATMADESLNEVAHHVITKYNCDICLVMNMNTKRVSFRTNKHKCPEVDLGALAASISDGGGHKYAAGGKITEQILTLTKILNLVKS